MFCVYRHTIALQYTGPSGGDFRPGVEKCEEVGRRLAQWALAKTYGKDVAACGPLYKSSRQDDGKIVVEFNYVCGGLAARGDAQGAASSAAGGSMSVGVITRRRSMRRRSARTMRNSSSPT